MELAVGKVFRNISSGRTAELACHGCYYLHYDREEGSKQKPWLFQDTLSHIWPMPKPAKKNSKASPVSDLCFLPLFSICQGLQIFLFCLFVFVFLFNFHLRGLKWVMLFYNGGGLNWTQKHLIKQVGQLILFIHRFFNFLPNFESVKELIRISFVGKHRRLG